MWHRAIFAGWNIAQAQAEAKARHILDWFANSTVQPALPSP